MKNKIEWCNLTFNPVWGCNNRSECKKYCYARIFAKRFYRKTAKAEFNDYIMALFNIFELDDRGDFIKIDTEGHDFEIIKGGWDLFKNGQVNIIQFEYGGCNIDARVYLKDFFDFFSNMNYCFYKIYPDHVKPIYRYDQRLDNFQYQNWLIIKDDYDFIQ